MTIKKSNKMSPKVELKRALLIVLVYLAVWRGQVLAYPGQVQIFSHKEIPIVDGMFRMGPSTGFPVPFTLTQSFDKPPGATKVYGTIAWGPCRAAEFIEATPGYTTGGYPAQACSWIMWDPAPDTVTVTVRYTGNWLQNYIGWVRWFAWEDGSWAPYCLIGEPDQYEHCPASLYLEAQPITVHLPIILKGFP